MAWREATRLGWRSMSRAWPGAKSVRTSIDMGCAAGPGHRTRRGCKLVTEQTRQAHGGFRRHGIPAFKDRSAEDDPRCVTRG